MRCVHLPHLPCKCPLRQLTRLPLYGFVTLPLSHISRSFPLSWNFIVSLSFSLLRHVLARLGSLLFLQFPLSCARCCCMPLRATEVISWQPFFLLHYLPVTYLKFMEVARATSCQPTNRLPRWKHPFVASLRFIVVVHNNIRNFWVCCPSVLRWL